MELSSIAAASNQSIASHSYFRFLTPEQNELLPVRSSSRRQLTCVSFSFSLSLSLSLSRRLSLWSLPVLCEQQVRLQSLGRSVSIGVGANHSPELYNDGNNLAMSVCLAAISLVVPAYGAFVRQLTFAQRHSQTAAAAYKEWSPDADDDEHNKKNHLTDTCWL